MEHLIKYAWSLVTHTHRYQYGGQDPIVGFDCSGFVMELLMAAGEIPFGTPKMSAQMIYNHYEHLASSGYAPGSLSFYGPDTLHIDHIGFCLDPFSMLEAGGGTAATVSDADAIARHAFLKMRPIKYRKDFLCVLKPQYIKLGMLS